jgi:hypothetical protein
MPMRVQFMRQRRVSEFGERQDAFLDREIREVPSVPGFPGFYPTPVNSAQVVCFLLTI